MITFDCMHACMQGDRGFDGIPGMDGDDGIKGAPGDPVS